VDCTRVISPLSSNAWMSGTGRAHQLLPCGVCVGGVDCSGSGEIDHDDDDDDDDDDDTERPTPSSPRRSRSLIIPTTGPSSSTSASKCGASLCSGGATVGSICRGSTMILVIISLACDNDFRWVCIISSHRP
jgi:hypothetical protein